MRKERRVREKINTSVRSCPHEGGGGATRGGVKFTII